MRGRRRVVWIVAAGLLGLLACCGVAAVEFFRGLKVDMTLRDVEAAFRYDGASVEPHMRWGQCQGYRQVAGTATVLALHRYSTGFTAPDSGMDDWFFVEVAPDLLKAGQELVVPGPGVRPYLAWERGPWCRLSQDLTGLLTILRVSAAALEGHLSIRAGDESLHWQYEGDVIFAARGLEDSGGRTTPPPARESSSSGFALSFIFSKRYRAVPWQKVVPWVFL